ncbi:MAG: signal peptidase, partial [Frankiales bacterium]|nr:signal peptidase [Frankiales bacterium]
MGKDTTGRSSFWGSREPEPDEPASSEPVESAATPEPDRGAEDEASPVGSPMDEAPPPAPDPAADLTPPTPPIPPAAPARSKWRRRRRGKASKLELPILIAVAIAIAIVLKTFVLQPFYIPSESMENTLYGCTGCSGDRILVFKPVYQVRSPHPGDIVVFKAPVDWNEGDGVSLSSNPLIHAAQWFGQLVGVVPPTEKDLVKRVIAVGGQTVKCCDDSGNVQISDNGPGGPWRSLNEPYIFEPSPWSKSSTPGVSAPGDSRSFGPVTVPKGRLWVMGDHRSDSADSRYHCGDGGVLAGCDPVQSTVAVSSVIGKAVVIAWPPSRWRTLGTPKTFESLGLPSPIAPGGAV